MFVDTMSFPESPNGIKVSDYDFAALCESSRRFEHAGSILQGLVSGPRRMEARLVIVLL